MATELFRHLEKWRLKDRAQDVRGRPLKGRDGNTLGTVKDYRVDIRNRTVEFLILEDGTEYPASGIEIRGGEACLLPAGEPRQAASKPIRIEQKDEADHLPVWHQGRE